jgi:hypothetical protein
MVIKYNNVFHAKALQIFTQIGIFGLKINHLATLKKCLAWVPVLRPFFKTFALPSVRLEWTKFRHFLAILFGAIFRHFLAILLGAIFCHLGDIVGCTFSNILALPIVGCNFLPVWRYCWVQFFRHWAISLGAIFYL